MHQSDIDIDFADRNQILQYIPHIPACKLQKGVPMIHNSGVYVQPIPFNPIIGCASIHYKEADDRGYFKLDLLNVSIYNQIRDKAHYERLLAMDPPWHRLKEKDFVEQLIHISKYYQLLQEKEVNSIPRLAMFLALIRPAKQHLIDKPWKEIAETIWDKPTDGSYYFKKAHSVSYAMLVALHMKILDTTEPA